MTTQRAVPKCLEDWVQTLSPIHLPVSSEAQEQTLRALNNPSLSFRDIAEVLQQHPTQALCLMRRASHEAIEPCTTLETALHRLGIEQSLKLLREQPIKQPGANAHALEQVTLISQHAAQQAMGLFGARLGRLQQEVYWGSLLFLAPLWSLAYAFPEELQTWEQKVMVKGQRAERVEKHLFGVNIRHLLCTLAEHWHLPLWVIQGYQLLDANRRLLAKALSIARNHENPLQQQQMLDDDPTLRRWLTQPSNTVLLANGLACAAHASWDNRHTSRWLGLTSLYLQQPLVQVQQWVHQQAANSARNHPPKGLWHPAQALLWPAHSAHLRATRNKAPSATDLQNWRTHCSQLLQQPSPFSNAVQLTACARDALAACGLKRILLMLSDRQHSRVQAQHLFGLPETSRGLQLSTQSHQLLRQLLTQPQRLLLSSNHHQIQPELPPEISTQLCQENGLIHSIANQGRVVILVFADQGDAPLHPTTLQAVDKTVLCIERALDYFARRKTEPPPPSS